MSAILSRPQCVNEYRQASSSVSNPLLQDYVIKWKHFPCYWRFVWGIDRSLVNSPRKGQWRGALMFSLICAWINGWVNNGDAGDLIHYDVTVIPSPTWDAHVTSRLDTGGPLWCCRRQEAWVTHRVLSNVQYNRVTQLPTYSLLIRVFSKSTPLLN